MNADTNNSNPPPAGYTQEVAKNFLSVIKQTRKCKLPIHQVSILLQLFVNPGEGQTSIAKRLGVNKNHLNNNIRLLLAKGLMEQKADASKLYNKKTHFLTRKGKLTVETILKHEHL